jgi:hypothetical protein
MQIVIGRFTLRGYDGFKTAGTLACLILKNAQLSMAPSHLEINWTNNMAQEI